MLYDTVRIRIRISRMVLGGRRTIWTDLGDLQYSSLGSGTWDTPPNTTHPIRRRPKNKEHLHRDHTCQSGLALISRLYQEATQGGHSLQSGTGETEHAGGFARRSHMMPLPAVPGSFTGPFRTDARIRTALPSRAKLAALLDKGVAPFLAKVGPSLC